MNVEIKSTQNETASEKVFIDNWLDKIFSPENNGIEWVTSVDWRVFLFDNNVLVSNVEIIERDALIGSSQVTLGGIGGVSTLPEFRNRGFARMAMEHADNFILEQLQVDFGLLLTGNDIAPFYEKLGWSICKNPLYFDQSTGKTLSDDVTMILPNKNRLWPEGNIDLCGLPW
jgi:predicted acetyltransferase